MLETAAPGTRFILAFPRTMPDAGRPRQRQGRDPEIPAGPISAACDGAQPWFGFSSFDRAMTFAMRAAKR
jgi:hypothetical protein